MYLAGRRLARAGKEDVFVRAEGNFAPACLLTAARNLQTQSPVQMTLLIERSEKMYRLQLHTLAPELIKSGGPLPLSKYLCCL